MTKVQEYQQVNCSQSESSKSHNEKKSISQDQMQREVDYARAQHLLESMLDEELITLSEFDKITALNRESFSPALAEIMP